jgi:T5orf172 domain
MKIRDECEKGWPSGVNLRQRLAAIVREDRVHRYKVGRTNNPQARAKLYEGRGSQYDEMILIYRSISPAHAIQLETILDEDFRDVSDNLNGGSAGRHGEDGPYYVYIVVRR